MDKGNNHEQYHFMNIESEQGTFTVYKTPDPEFPGFDIDYNENQLIRIEMPNEHKEHAELYIYEFDHLDQDDYKTKIRLDIPKKKQRN